jgi:TPP-dependent pyruvate/acetoin dehydrogenase alpha subunit
MHGHAAHDNAWYVPKKLFDEWKKKDPIDRFEYLLLKSGVLTDEKINSMVSEIEQKMETSTKSALERPYPNPEAAATGVYAM